MDEDRNGWAEYRKSVLKQLETHNDKIASLESEMVQMKIALAVAQTKIAMAAFGISAATSAVIVWIMSQILP
jgi:hypothetical protein